MILSCRALRYGCSDTSKTKNVFTGDDPIYSSGIFFISIFGDQGDSGTTCK